VFAITGISTSNFTSEKWD